MNDEEKLAKAVALAREIEYEWGLDENCGFDVIRYCIECRCLVAEGVRKHRATHEGCGQ